MTRTSRKLMIFTRPFFLRTIDAVLPAGTYDVQTDEELVEGLSFLAYRRTGTWIHLPAVGIRSGGAQMVLVQPAELDEGTDSSPRSA